MINRLFGRDRHLGDAELSGYADGSLDTRSTRRVEGHLAAFVAACAAQLEEMRTTIAILQSVDCALAPRSFAIDPATVADIPERSSAKAEWLRSPVFAPALAASVAAVFFAVVLVANVTGTISQSGRAVEQATVAMFAGADEVESDQAPAAVVMPTVEVEAQVEVDPETVMEAAAPVAPAAAPEPPSEATALEAAAPVAEAAVAGAEDDAPLMEAAVAEAEEIAPVTEAADEEPGVASRAADATPGPLPSPRPAPAGAIEAPALEQPTAVGVAVDEGRRLPVWQLELASGLAALVLAGAAAVLFRRRRRQ